MPRVDSIFLLEEGFDVVSCDGSDQMLKYALKERFAHRKKPAFDNWIIEKANWLSLYDDIGHLVGDDFDAVICMRSSIAHLLDHYGDQHEQKQALRNFERCIKPGGLLILDHRNYDNLMNCGSVPSNTFYYNSSYHTGIKTNVMYSDGEPKMIIMDYFLDSSLQKDGQQMQNGAESGESKSDFRLSYYPIQLEPFKKLLKDIFNFQENHEILGHFKKLSDDYVPYYYIHIIEKM